MANTFGSGRTLKQICWGCYPYNKATASQLGRALKVAGVKPTGHNGTSLLWDAETVLPALATMTDSGRVVGDDIMTRLEALEKQMKALQAALGGPP